MLETGVTSDTLEETEANALAAMLLIPTELFPAAYASDKPSFGNADALTKQFEVSLQAALRRLVRASNWACTLVFLERGRVKWWVESSYFDYFVPIGRTPHPSSIAAQLAAQAADREGMLEDAISLPLSAWIDSSEADSDKRLWEESRYLPDGYIYSLLTVID